MRSIATILIVITAPIFIVLFWPINSRQPTTEAQNGFAIVHKACVAETRNVAFAGGLDWVDGATDSFCMCIASSLLLSVDREDILQTSQRWVSEPEVFHAFMRLESV